MERVILHCDANAFYASVECLYTPSIRNCPVAVCGNVEERHGIVLTKNQIAKAYGIQTGEAIWQARQKCPKLVCVPPDYALYIRFSAKMRQLYEEYSDRVGISCSALSANNIPIQLGQHRIIKQKEPSCQHIAFGRTVCA